MIVNITNYGSGEVNFVEYQVSGLSSEQLNFLDENLEEQTSIVGDDLIIKSYFEDKSILESWDMFCQLCNEYNGIIIDIYSFNVTINCFITQWIRNLKMCTPDDYAAAY